MAEKKRKNRWSYLDDFHQDVSGEYRYTGKHYTLSKGPSRGKTQLITAVLTAVAALSVIGVGFIPSPSMTGNGNIYVVPPYIFELIAVFLTVWAAVYLIFPAGEQPERLRLRAYTYQRSIGKLPHRTVIAAVTAGLSAAANIVYIILNGFGGKYAESIAVPVLHLIAGAAVLWLRSFTSSLVFEESAVSCSAFPADDAGGKPEV